jgi:hypothetical protein
VLAILFAGYTFLFTGKKRTITLSSPAAKTNEADSRASLSATAGETMKLDVSKMNLSWRDDPFFLPRSVTDKKSEKPKTVPKLVAIMESKTGRYAIIGGEIVKKGDMVGDEKVSEISKDKVVLVRNNAKRILSIEDTGQ